MTGSSLKVLHVFDHSVPLQSGYTFRSLALLEAQRRLGWTTLHLTTPKHTMPGPTFEEVDGKSFYRQWTGEEEPSGYDRFVTLESTWQAQYALRTNTHKFILGREPDVRGVLARELYDLKADPDENHDLAASQPELAAEMEREMEAWIREKLHSVGKTFDPVVEEGAVNYALWKNVKATVV